jgi:hypothetical protein
MENKRIPYSSHVFGGPLSIFGYTNMGICLVILKTVQLTVKKVLGVKYMFHVFQKILFETFSAPVDV